MADSIENRFWQGLQLYKSSKGVFYNLQGQRYYLKYNSIVEDRHGCEVGRGPQAALDVYVISVPFRPSCCLPFWHNHRLPHYWYQSICNMFSRARWCRYASSNFGTLLLTSTPSNFGAFVHYFEIKTVSLH
jgi:hypothetical protein